MNYMLPLQGNRFVHKLSRCIYTHDVVLRRQCCEYGVMYHHHDVECGMWHVACGMWVTDL